MTVPFHPVDLDLIDLAPEHREIARRTEAQMLDLGRDARTLAVTCIAGTPGHEAIAVFGCRQDGQVFIFPSVKEIHEHKFTFLRDLRRELVRMKRIFRVVTSLSKDTEGLRRFFGHLGFEPDGVEHGLLRWVAAR